MHPYLADYQVLESCLELAMTYEEEMIAAFEKQTIQKIKRQSSNKFHPLGIKNLDYIAISGEPPEPNISFLLTRRF